MCQCGCRGWCTYWILLKYTQWDFEICATGVNQESGPLGRKFDPEEDSFYFEFKSKPRRIRPIVIESRGDWPAWADLACIRQWTHQIYPCPECNCPSNQLHDLENVTMCALLWEPYNEEAFHRDLNRHEIVVACGIDLIIFFCLSTSWLYFIFCVS